MAKQGLSGGFVGEPSLGIWSSCKASPHGSSLRQAQNRSLTFEFARRASLRQAAWSPPTTSALANRILSRISRARPCWGFAPQDCLVIEDAPAGIRSGKAAGARVLALQTTETNDLPIAAGADYFSKKSLSTGTTK